MTFKFWKEVNLVITALSVLALNRETTLLKFPYFYLRGMGEILSVYHNINLDNTIVSNSSAGTPFSSFRLEHSARIVHSNLETQVQVFGHSLDPKGAEYNISGKEFIIYIKCLIL
jgi:hypothetical protein